MGLVGRTLFLEIASSALLGTALFTFVVFLQRLGRLFEQLVRGSATPEAVGSIFLLLLPPVLTFTIPVGVLVGTLMALSRMSADGEITALRASGVPGRRLLLPVFAFAFLGMALTGAASSWLNPLAVRQTYKILNELAAAELTAEIQPRVFEEQFPNTILYVGDVVPGSRVRWRKVFIADITPADQRKGVVGDGGDGPRITTASEAIAEPEAQRSRIQLSLLNGSTHQTDKDWMKYQSTTFPSMEQMLEAAKRTERRPLLQFTSMDTGPLWKVRHTSLEAMIELHQRLALPPACILLALIAIPLGVSSRKGGKSSALVMTVGIAFLYYMGFISLIGLAKQGTLPVQAALWIPNSILLLLSIWMLARLERPGDRDLIASIRARVASAVAGIRGTLPKGPTTSCARRTFPLGPQIIDNYVLSTFLFYFLLLLTSFVMMTLVYNFFELLSEMLKNKIPMSLMGKYLLFLTPKLIYDSTPVSVLAAVLVTFGILTKNNEVTAMKACGVSVYRLAVPVFTASAALSAGLFAFDHYIVPDANRIQDSIRNQIKGRPVQTYLRPDRKWIFGEQSRIYYYKYFDPVEGVMLNVHVYELDPATFNLTRHITAERARWEPSLKTWIFQNGWARDFQDSRESSFKQFMGETATFAHLSEPPSYFWRENKQDKQMNFQELGTYIRELQQSGFDTIRLQVQFHKKFAVPLFALIMALISVPFAFVAANKGATAAITASFGIAIAYWAVSQLFEQVGNVNQLPASMAAWSPDAVFSLAGLYFLARLRT